ncbi:UNVERIFIED_CONTAM: acetyl-CoA carboxylase carboxyl transferase subunit beta, partial [Salmonella enterica subsp. enterica serovar Weltevreden]
MSWLDKISGGSKLLTTGRRSKSVPGGLWTKG